MAKKTLVELKEIHNEIIELLLSGYTSSQIVKHFKETQGLSETYTVSRITTAQESIRSAADVDHVLMTDLHLQYYEEAWQFFNEVDNNFGKNKALLAKEKLLGIHRENNNIEINNVVNIEVQVEEQYEISKLNPIEQSRLQLLLEKSHGKEIEKL